MGFEPTRAEHIGLAVQRLNHSATSSVDTLPIDVVRSCLKHVLEPSFLSAVTVSLELFDEIWTGRRHAPKSQVPRQTLISRSSILCSETFGKSSKQSSLICLYNE